MPVELIVDLYIAEQKARLGYQGTIGKNPLGRSVQRSDRHRGTEGIARDLD